MIAATSRTIELTEYARTALDTGELSYEAATTLWRTHSAQIAVDFPSPKTDNQWVLTPQGWVGQIPLSPTLLLRINPKVEIGNVFRMLEYAYRLKSFLMLKGLVEADTLQDVFERLAVILSRRVIARARKGFYRDYVPRKENLAYLRGRFDLRRSSSAPWKVQLPCHYHEHTPDVDENRILAWTLFVIGRTGLCGQPNGNVVSRAFRTLQGTVALNPYGPGSFFDRRYDRLNSDYAPMHALCSFFLAHVGPTHREGEHSMLPFLVDMARLYESFVAEWLKAHLPRGYRIKAQERVALGAGPLTFQLDLVLYDDHTDQPLRVLDTKYKAAGCASQEDIYQIVTYAKLKNCREAVLVYPSALDPPLDIVIGDVHVRSLTFALEGDLETSGQAFLSELLPA